MTFFKPMKWLRQTLGVQSNPGKNHWFRCYYVSRVRFLASITCFSKLCYANKLHWLFNVLGLLEL